MDRSEKQGDLGASVGPGCEASPSTASGVLAESHPSREEAEVADLFLAHALPTFGPWWSSMRKRWLWRLFASQREVAEAAYQDGMEIGVRSLLLTYDRVLERLARDTDRSGEADETAKQAQPEARAGAEAASEGIANPPPPPSSKASPNV